MILWFLLLVGTLASTSDASVLSTIDITRNTTLSNLTSNNLRSQSNSSVAEIDFRISYCTKKQTWSVPEVKPDDCCGVLDYFYLETVDETFRKSKEFKAPGAKKTSRVPTQTTPRKYTFGTCTLAIVMLPDFPNPATLPGGFKTGPSSDTSTYFNIWTTAKNVVERCVEGKGEMGWQSTGARFGIGVFIWSTGSHEDEIIQADEPRLIFPTLRTLLNGSVASV